MDKFIKLRQCSKDLEKLLADIESIKKNKLKETPELDRDEQSRLLLGELNYRVIHANNNPLDQALKRKQSDIENIKRENERLRARLALLEAGDGVDLTRRIDDAVNSASKIEQLTKKVEELKARENKILNSYKKTSHEFREACYLLTGYRIDPLKDNIFRLSHMYAEREEDKLYFEVTSDGVITLLQNDYTEQYKQFITNYLENADSFPAFLAAITLDLFKASTQIDMSMDMSTTMIQRN